MLAPHQLEELLQNVPPPAWSFRPNPDAWSINEVVVHLADNEAVDFVRTRLALAGSESPHLPYDEARWARDLDYEREPAPEALAAFSVLRSRTYGLFGRIPDTAWSRPLKGPHDATLTLEERLRSAVEHDELHRSQIQDLHTGWERALGG